MHVPKLRSDIYPSMLFNHWESWKIPTPLFLLYNAGHIRKIDCIRRKAGSIARADVRFVEQEKSGLMSNKRRLPPARFTLLERTGRSGGKLTFSFGLREIN